MTTPIPPTVAARIRVVEAMEHFDRTFSHTAYPQAVLAAQQALTAVESWADTKRETGS